MELQNKEFSKYVFIYINSKSIVSDFLCLSWNGKGSIDDGIGRADVRR